MSLIYFRTRLASRNTQLRTSVYTVALSLTAPLWLLTAGCVSTIPQYVRGDVAARATESIPPGATYRILRTHVASPSERELSEKLDSVLRGFGLRPTETAEAQLEIDFAHTTSASGTFWSESNAIFEASDSRRRRFAVEVAQAEGDGRLRQVLWRGELQSDSANRNATMLVDSFLRLVLSSFNRDRAPTAFSFRIDAAGIAEREKAQAARARRTVRPAPTAVIPEPGVALELADLSLPRVQAVNTAEGSAPMGVAEGITATAAVESVVESVVETAEPAAETAEPVVETAEPVAETAEPVVRRGREPMTMFGALFGTTPRSAPRSASPPAPKASAAPPEPQGTAAAVPVEPIREPATPAAPPRGPAAPPQAAVPTPQAASQEEAAPRPVRPEPVVEEETPVPEFSDVGPTWHDAVEVCDELTAREDVNCSIFVEVHSATPHLELSYLDADRAKQAWAGDAPSVAGAFCVTAARHGLYGKAVILIRSGNASATKKCKEVAR